MNTRPITYLVAALVAVGAAAWALQSYMAAPKAPAPANAAASSPPVAGSGATAAGIDPLAAASAPAVNADRFKLVGVMAGAASAGASGGVALIAVGGQPARTFRVGETVEGDIVVRNVSANGATLGPRGAGAPMALEVPPAPPPRPVAAPMPMSPPPGKVFDNSPESREVLNRLGSKHPPLPPQTWPQQSKPAQGTTP